MSQRPWLYQTQPGEKLRTDCLRCQVIFNSCNIPGCTCSSRSSPYSKICVHCRLKILNFKCATCKNNFTRQSLSQIYCSKKCKDIVLSKRYRAKKDVFFEKWCQTCKRKIIANNNHITNCTQCIQDNKLK